MPIYDYKCEGCGQQFEMLILKSTVAACPACGGRDLEQLPSTGIGVSSASIRKSNLEAAQRAQRNSSNFRDQQIAQNEAQMHEIKEHAPQMLRPNKKKKK